MMPINFTDEQLEQIIGIIYNNHLSSQSVGEMETLRGVDPGIDLGREPLYTTIDEASQLTYERVQNMSYLVRESIVNREPPLVDTRDNLFEDFLPYAYHPWYNLGFAGGRGISGLVDYPTIIKEPKKSKLSKEEIEQYEKWINSEE